MAFTFLKAQGKEIGKSLVEPDLIETAREILADAEKREKMLLLPEDCVVAPSLDTDVRPAFVSVDEIPSDLAGYDIGPMTAKRFSNELSRAKTIFWNGPMGVFETIPYNAGTTVVAHALAGATDRGAISVVGGGDSVAAIQQADLAKRISHISTGGGASLEFMEGRTLPGVAALNGR